MLIVWLLIRGRGKDGEERWDGFIVGATRTLPEITDIIQVVQVTHTPSFELRLKRCKNCSQLAGHSPQPRRLGKA
jgi:hypothetical protein